MSLSDILQLVTNGVSTGVVIAVALGGFWVATGRHLWRSSFGKDGPISRIHDRLGKIEQNQEEAIIERETDRSVSQKLFTGMREDISLVHQRLDSIGIDHQALRDRTVRLEALEEIRQEVARVIVQQKEQKP